jgi:hypothetical protein
MVEEKLEVTKKIGLPLALLVIVILAGSYIRLIGLGTEDFDYDELIHYYAAKSIGEGKAPLLPSGLVYSRGIDLTRLVALSVQNIDDPERAARLPSAAFGILNLILFGAVAWMIGGAWPAVWATLLLAVYPEAIFQSRITRFYTYQLCFGLIALGAGWFAFRRVGEGAPKGSSEIQGQWMLVVLTGVAFLLAARIQITTFSVALGWMVFVTIVAGRDFFALRAESLRRSVPLQIVLLSGVFGALVLILSPGILSEIIRQARFNPVWAKSTAGGPLFYYYTLSDAFPLIVSLAPLIFVAAAIENKWLTLYLAAWFGVPLSLHSVLFAWKGDRFVFLAMPALFLASGIAAEIGCRKLYRFLGPTLNLFEGNSMWRKGFAGGIVAIVSIFAVMTTPAFNAARKIPAMSGPRDNWRMAGEIIQSIDKNGVIPIGSSIPLNGLFYWGHVDFVVGLDFGETLMQNAHKTSDISAVKHVRDDYVGAPIVLTPDAIRTQFGKAGSVIIGIDSKRWSFGNIDPGLQKILLAEGTELCQERCGELRLYLWSFRASV